jgi:hypothetical protein
MSRVDGGKTAPHPDNCGPNSQWGCPYETPHGHQLLNVGDRSQLLNVDDSSQFVNVDIQLADRQIDRP